MGKYYKKRNNCRTIAFTDELNSSESLYPEILYIAVIPDAFDLPIKAHDFDLNDNGWATFYQIHGKGLDTFRQSIATFPGVTSILTKELYDLLRAKTSQSSKKP